MFVCQFSLLLVMLLLHQENKKAPELVQLANALFLLENIYPGLVEPYEKIQLKIKVKTITLNCMLVTTDALPIAFVHGLHWINPCLPTLVIPECYKPNQVVVNLQYLKVFKFSIKGIVIFLNHWMWSLAVQATVACVGILNLMCITTVHQFIHCFESIN